MYKLNTKENSKSHFASKRFLIFKLEVKLVIDTFGLLSAFISFLIKITNPIKNQ